MEAKNYSGNWLQYNPPEVKFFKMTHTNVTHACALMMLKSNSILRNQDLHAPIRILNINNSNCGKEMEKI